MHQVTHSLGVSKRAGVACGVEYEIVWRASKRRVSVKQSGSEQVDGARERRADIEPFDCRGERWNLNKSLQFPTAAMMKRFLFSFFFSA